MLAYYEAQKLSLVCICIYLNTNNVPIELFYCKYMKMIILKKLDQISFFLLMETF